MEGRKGILEHQIGKQSGTLQPLSHFTLKSPILYCFLMYSETNFFSHFKMRSKFTRSRKPTMSASGEEAGKTSRGVETVSLTLFLIHPPASL